LSQPQWTTPVILYDTAWSHITFQFTATEAYDYITFGNFVDDASTNAVTYDSIGPIFGPGAFYFIDDIEVKNDSVPQANFIASSTSVCEKFCVSFSDQSTNNPTSWQWIFPSGNPSSSPDQNPTNICYDEPGTYDITLITTNANGSDTLTLQNYMTVYATPAAPTITQNGNTLTSSESEFYQWQLDAVDIPGATNQSYEVLQTGFYTVIVSDSNGCKNSTTSFVEITGIDVLNNESFSIYPNPSSDFIKLHLSSPPSTFSIFNLLGEKMKEEKVSLLAGQAGGNDITMDVSELPAGLYIVRAENATVGKFVKE
jgi:PKD repeat protein